MRVGIDGGPVVGPPCSKSTSTSNTAACALRCALRAPPLRRQRLLLVTTPWQFVGLGLLARLFPLYSFPPLSILSEKWLRCMSGAIAGQDGSRGLAVFIHSARCVSWVPPLLAQSSLPSFRLRSINSKEDANCDRLTVASVRGCAPAAASCCAAADEGSERSRDSDRPCDTRICWLSLQLLSGVSNPQRHLSRDMMAMII